MIYTREYINSLAEKNVRLLYALPEWHGIEEHPQLTRVLAGFMDYPYEVDIAYQEITKSFPINEYTLFVYADDAIWVEDGLVATQEEKPGLYQSMKRRLARALDLNDMLHSTMIYGRKTKFKKLEMQERRDAAKPYARVYGTTNQVSYAVVLDKNNNILFVGRKEMAESKPDPLAEYIKNALKS